MGQVDDAQIRSKDASRSKKSSRGSVNNSKRLAAFAESSGRGGADWGNADPRWIREVVLYMQMLGGAVTFGLSRDGGAHMLTLLLDGERQTLWYNGDADLDAALEQVCATLETMR
jgi:hypothetical protein